MSSTLITYKTERSVYFSAIRSPSPLQNQLSFAEVDFSLFVLELPLQNEKRKSSSTIRFGSQIEKQKLEFTIRFGTSASNSKSRIVFPLFVLELSLPKRKAELLELNFRFGTWMEEPSRLLTTRFGTVAPSGKPHSEISQFHHWTSHPNRNLDPRQKKKKEWRPYERNSFTEEWAWLVGVSVGGECLTIGE